ncbi:PA2169 family four-helix-bundle protein [uncultured Cyclobacterium sp.]|uniref:ferritin-like domain-containing protein n=1 Tax=uncultured Cyclobacterium sp. TaxID=453820 RepID=UPI0030ECDDFF|tara:strand:+ start:213502 stop:213954 length:453 start_codon:yes stop_codon:yes gene_type:complete
METTDKKLRAQLAEILEKNKDAEKGYETAAVNTQHPGLRNFFLKRSNERRDFNLRLKRELEANFDEMTTEGSFTGSIHRAWMDTKSFFAGNNDAAMLEEAIRGDQAALEEYEELLGVQHLPIMLDQIIQNHAIKIRTDLEQIKTLEDLIE